MKLFLLPVSGDEKSSFLKSVRDHPGTIHESLDMPRNVHDFQKSRFPKKKDHENEDRENKIEMILVMSRNHSEYNRMLLNTFNLIPDV